MTGAEIRRVLVVDLSSVFWGIALGGGLRNTNAARDLAIREIRSLATGYDRVAIAVDGRGRSFRAAIWDPIAATDSLLKPYKFGRQERDEHLWTLLADTARACGLAGWHVFEAPPSEEHPGHSFEADDVAATIAAYCSGELGASVDILSSDADLAQLVDDERGIRLLRKYKGIHPKDEAAVFDWLHVPPSAVVELKALAGDDSDKYKPFPGVAEKTALAMLEPAKYSAAVALQMVLDSDKKSVVGDRIRALGSDRLAIGYRLARLRRDVPLDCGRILEQREPVATQDLGADLVPDDEPPLADAEPVAPQHAPTRANGQNAAMVRVDPTARMLISPAEVRQRLVEFQHLIKSVLVENVDYGRIPGCGDKPVLYKSGAEKCGEVYGYAPTFEVQQAIERWGDDGQPPLFFYRVKCVLLRKVDGVAVAECIGSANSRETKWGARWVFERDVPEHLSREHLKRREFTTRQGPRTGEKFFKYQVPNEDIFDQVNTILKMAEKRAFVGAILLACRASGVFAVDVEDLRPDADAYGNPSDRPQWQQ